MKRTTVLFLQHVWGDPPGLLAELLHDYAIPFEVVQAEEQSAFDISLSRAIISLGGPQHAADELSLHHERQLINDALAQQHPFLGICLGAQLLAAVAGATISPLPEPEVGWYEATLTPSGQQDPFFEGFTQHQLRVFHWHNDAFSLPNQAQLLAQGSTGLNQAFRIGPCAYGLQYHIELTEALFETWFTQHPEREQILNRFGMDYYQAQEDEAKTIFTTYRTQTRLLFTNFLKLSNVL